MHVAIDDTYGPKTIGQSRYVTGERRTSLAVIFGDDEVDGVRSQMTECLSFASDLVGAPVKEFHFTDIYNRKKPWHILNDGENLQIFSAFAAIYRAYRWPVAVQTIDDRTLNDHSRVELKGKIDGLDCSKRADLSLIMLCLKIKKRFASPGEPLRVLVDQGVGKPGQRFGTRLFRDWPGKYDGRYVPSTEPLIQIADFVAYCVNRSTILQLKPQRAELDAWFLNLVGTMQINCPDVGTRILSADFDVSDLDEFHRHDRVQKGIEGC